MKNNKEKKSKERKDFPKITVDLAIQYTKKISSDSQGDIVTYDEIGKAIRKSGGNLARIVSALNDFGLIEKAERPKNWRITPLGSKIVSKDSQEDKLKSFLTPPANSRIWEEYKQTRPSPDSLMNYLKKEGFGDKPAKKLAKLYLKSYDQFSMKSPLSIQQHTGSKQEIEEDEEEEVVSSERIYLSYLVGSIFPQEVENIEDSLDEVISIAKSENLQQLLTAANFLKISISGKDKGEVTLELKKFAPQIKEIMKQELGLEK